MSAISPIQIEYNNQNKLVYLDKNNNLIEGFINKPFKTFIRRLVISKKIIRYKTWRKNGGCEICFNGDNMWFVY